MIEGTTELTEDTPVLQTLPQTLEFLGYRRLIVDLDDSSIGTDNPMWGQYREGGSNTKEDDHQEGLWLGGNEEKLGQSRIQCF